MRSIFDTSAENANIEDWVADGAVGYEPLSASGSLISRDNTGKNFDSGLFAALERKKPLTMPALFLRIP